MTKRKIVSVSEVESSEMTVATDAEIRNLDRVWRYIANQRWSHEKAISIKLDPSSIVVVVKTSLDRVTLTNEVLTENVGDVNILMSSVEPVQAAVCILLQHRKISTVELNSVVVQCSKNSCAEVVVEKNESAEIGN